MMKLAKPRYEQLKKRVDECKSAFGVQKLADTQNRGTQRHSKDELVTRAYLVLVHACFEEFFENVAIDVSVQALQSWAGPKKSIPACALLSSGRLSQGSRDSAEEEPRFTDRGRKMLEAAVASHRTYAQDSNNGISEKHLRELFAPLGIDLPEDVRLRTAIDELKKIRGDAAHRQRNGLSDQKPMKEWIRTVSECLEFCLALAHRIDAIDW